RAKGNAAEQNGNQIRCYNCRGVGIQLQAEEYDLMAAAANLDEIEEVNAKCILMANLQQASTSGTQTDSAPVYDTDESKKSSVTSNSVSTPQESKGVNNDKVIAPGMFRINPDKTFRKEKHVPNTVSASARTKPITISQPPIITKKDVNSNLNGLSSTGIDNTKTRRPQPRSNTKNDRVPSASKSSRSKNKEAEVE
nr:hypothetical protein [Tanacetum cinerariifolium]